MTASILAVKPMTINSLEEWLLEPIEQTGWVGEKLVEKKGRSLKHNSKGYVLNP